MGEIFVSPRPLVPIPKISSKNACVKHKLVGIIHNLIEQVGCGVSVGVCNGVIDMTPDNLDGVGGGICLVEMLVVCEPVCIGDDIVGLVEVGKQIQSAGSVIPSVRPVFYPYKIVLKGAQKLLLKGAVYVPKCVESKCCRVMNVAYGHYFKSGGACQYYKRRSGIGREHNMCCREGRVHSRGEGEVKVSDRATAKVYVDGSRVQVEELMHGVDCGKRRFAVNWWDRGVFEALDKLIDGGVRNGGPT